MRKIVLSVLVALVPCLLLWQAPAQSALSGYGSTGKMPIMLPQRPGEFVVIDDGPKEPVMDIEPWAGNPRYLEERSKEILETERQEKIQQLKQDIQSLEMQLQAPQVDMVRERIRQKIQTLQKMLQSLQTQTPITPKPTPTTPPITTDPPGPRNSRQTPSEIRPLSPENESALINKLQTDAKHETLLTDILNALDSTPADAVKLGAVVKAAFERLVIMQQQKTRSQFCKASL